mmetsp:Transcript_1438/g.2396  ORF Transcript_1438/g.2396 Transcript_1438/m.2396 type:complete len:888 (+) Transcript_1438:739-3402(+)
MEEWKKKNQLMSKAEVGAEDTADELCDGTIEIIEPSSSRNEDGLDEAEAEEEEEEERTMLFRGVNYVFDERIGERVSEDILTRCEQCIADTPCDQYTNCPNCNVRFLQCSTCSAKYDGCCSQACRLEAVQRTTKQQHQQQQDTKSSHMRRKQSNSNMLGRVLRVSKNEAQQQDHAFPTSCDTGASSSSSQTPAGTGLTQALSVDVPDAATEGLIAYSELHSQPEPALLTALRRHTEQVYGGQPGALRMLSDPLQGRILALLAAVVSTTGTTSGSSTQGLSASTNTNTNTNTNTGTRILELGTFTGYSAISMALALDEEDKKDATTTAAACGGHVTTCEPDPAAADIARRYIQQGQLQDKIDLRAQKANEVISDLIVDPHEPQFHMVFMDADKKQYRHYLSRLMGEEEEEEEEDSEEELYGRRRGRAGGEQEEDGYGGNLGSIKNRAGRGASAAGGKKKKTKKHKKYGDESGSSSGEDSDEEDDDEEALRLRRKREKDRRALLEDKSGPGNLESYLRVQLRRYQIVALIKEPFVKQALVGQYVRFTVGEIAQQAVCRMCEILAVELDARPYRMAESGQMCTTRLTLAMAGSVKKSVRICLVSNSRITQDEFDFYRAKLRELRGKPAKVDGEEGEEEEDSEPDEEDDDEDYFDPKTVTRSRARRRLLTKQQIEAQRMTLKSYLMGEHVYTDKEVKEMVSKSAGLDKSKTTEFTTAMESLQKKLAAARDSTDYEALEVIQKTIDTLQQRYDEQKEIFDRTAKKQMMVNRKMKLSNIERDMAAGKRLRQEQLAAEARGVKSNAQADPFTRRECRPKILWNTGTTLDSLAATGAGSADSAAGAGADAGEATEGDIGDAAGVAGSGSGSVEPSTASLLSTQQQPQNQQQQQQQ